MIDHITLSHTREDEAGRLQRLNQVVGYLSAVLSPIDLKIIKSLHDHKGELTVTLDKMLFDLAVDIAGNEYESYLKAKIRTAWDVQNEDGSAVEYVYEGVMAE